MRDIRRDFPHFTMSFAPVQSSLEDNYPGMGGFVYKDLWGGKENGLHTLMDNSVIFRQKF